MLQSHRAPTTGSLGRAAPSALLRGSGQAQHVLSRRACLAGGGANLPAKAPTQSRGALLVARFREERGAGSDADKPTDMTKPDTPGDASGMPSDGEIVQGLELCFPSGPLSSVPVVFELCKHCFFGNTFAIVGDVQELGAWDTNKAAQLEWSEGDVWRTSVALPVGTPVSFKYIERGPDGQMVGWGQDVCEGGNMTVLVEPSDELISGYTVTMDPPMHPDPSPATNPYLTARLDVAAVLPVSATFFKEKSLAVASGLPSIAAEDMLTDRALTEQGLMSEAELAARWSEDQMNAVSQDLTGQQPDHQAQGPEGQAEEAGGVSAGYTDAGSIDTAVRGGLMEAGDDELVAGGEAEGPYSPHPAGSSSSSHPAGRMITSTDVHEAGSSSAASGADELSSEEQSSIALEISAEDEGDWVPAGPPPAAAAPAFSSVEFAAIAAAAAAAAASFDDSAFGVGSSIAPILEGPDVDTPTPLSLKADRAHASTDSQDQPVWVVDTAPPSFPAAATGSTTDPSSSGPEAAPGAGGGTGFSSRFETELSSAVDAAAAAGPSAATTGMGDSCQPAPEGTKLVSASPAGGSIELDEPMSDPSSRAVVEVYREDLAPADPIHVHLNMRTTEGREVGSVGVVTGAQAPAGPRVKITADQPLSVNMRGEDPLSLPDAPEVAAVRGAEAPGGFDTEGKTLGPAEGLLVPPELAEGSAPAGAYAAAPAGDDVQEGPNTLPIAQVMAEAQVIADAAKTEAGIAGVQEVAQVLREAAREKKEQQQDTTGS